MHPDLVTAPLRNKLDPKPRPSRGLKRFGVAAVLVALAVVAYGVLVRSHDDSQVADWTAINAQPTVTVFHPEAVTGSSSLVLPGTLEAYYAAPIYARVPGYLQKWYQDIGARVRTGQILALIDTPDLDQELLQAKADLVSAEAGENLARITAQRWKNLLAKDAVSRQESDEKTGDLETKTAMVNAAKAKVDRLEALEGFKRIVAPFDGIVTARKTDIGDLINAGAGNGTELFEVSEVDKLRLYVSVPQAYSAQIRAGVTATLTVPEYPGRVFSARLDTSAGAVNDASGTELVELAVDNHDGALQPGDYAQVKFTMPAAMIADEVRIPESAVQFHNAGTQVGVIAPDGRHVELRPITIGLDNGSWVEVIAGLTPRDRVIDNPSDSLAQGDLVRVTQTEVPDVGLNKKGAGQS